MTTELCNISDHIFKTDPEDNLLCVRCNIEYLAYLKTLDSIAENNRQCKKT